VYTTLFNTRLAIKKVYISFETFRQGVLIELTV